MKRFLPTFIVLAVSLTVAELAARAATYNFYFNNTEQGDNSTAAPKVTVGEDKPATKAETSAPAVSAAAVPAPSESKVTASELAESPKPATQHWRFSLGLSAMQEFGASDSFSPEHPAEPGMSVSFFFNKYVGLTLFGAKLPTEDFSPNRWAFGLETEVLPFHITVAGIENFLELGVIGGVLAEHQDDSQVQGFYNTSAVSTSVNSYSTDYWKYLAEGGLRMNLNFGRNWGVISSLRATQDYALWEAAVALKL